MNEKKIEAAIRGWSLGYAMDHAAPMPVSQYHISALAHAIAKKLAEGVVWQREGIIQHLPIPPFGVNVTIYMAEENGYRVLRIATGKPVDAPVPEGQRVRVTVTKEGGDDGQEKHPE